MKDDTPTDADGKPLCAWCGGQMKQSGVGRARVYCKQSCRELAYRSRRTDRLIAEALAAVGADSSVDASRNRQLTEPDKPRPSVDETRTDPQAPPGRSPGVTKGGKRPILPPPPGYRSKPEA